MFNKLEKVLVPVWGLLWVLGITAVSVGVVIWSVKWVMTLLGVM